jgi:hypothetical protein
MKCTVQQKLDNLVTDFGPQACIGYAMGLSKPSFLMAHYSKNLLNKIEKRLSIPSVRGERKMCPEDALNIILQVAGESDAYGVGGVLTKIRMLNLAIPRCALRPHLRAWYPLLSYFTQRYS